jgi:Ni/Fe-hydrogenase 1 B-type cytochrome subunit
MAVGIVFRFYWSFVGNHFSREIIRPAFLAQSVLARGLLETGAGELARFAAPLHRAQSAGDALDARAVLWVGVHDHHRLASMARARGRAGSTRSLPGRCWLFGGNSFTVHTWHHLACGRW